MNPRSGLPRVVLAPMAGGPGTVALAAAVGAGGGFPFLPGGYLSPDRLAADVEILRAATDRPFGVNLFVPGPDRIELTQRAREYAAALAPMAELAGVELGRPTWDDDAYAGKLDALVQSPPAVVSFAFGWPGLDDVDRLHRVGAEVWVTLNDPAEVEWATELGVDGIVAQGGEAGGHRGGPVDNRRDHPTRDLVRAVRHLAPARTAVVAAGGVADGLVARALLDAGADAVAAGTAYLLADEAGTADVHRHALHTRSGTVVTRAFTGRSARALRTMWTERYSDAAPAAYPHVHHVTAPLRRHGKETGQPELVHLWAGTAHADARPGPAEQITEDLLAAL
ncbi:putative dioxygenase [Nostocoides japonicum T1-X7]|uniref:Propionate 3-nitronate monooxygenase n=1 Tax=Nostocoides japonicum T1-X7 TaxID=1194083 RepID=A0A077LWN9_9MICO|nr:nitronate monooxygenase [Tetrasphaera japonica]CCH76340.1 putative dioxygenase [Tetrasphaera japonica T1-X7]